MIELEHNPLQIRVGETGDSVSLRLDGELSISTANAFCETVLRLLENVKSARLDGSGVSTIDLAGLQSLCSAHRTFVRRNLSLKLESASEALRHNAHAAGFDARSICPYRRGSECLWVGI